MKDKAILNAGKTKPTIGTKIEGKNAAAIIFFRYMIYKVIYEIDTLHYISK